MDSMSSDESSNKPTASGAAEIPPVSDEEKRAREAFIATKRHDLRTPINTIIGYGEMLLEDARNDGKDDLAVDLEKILKAGQVLLMIVNDLLDPAKIDAGQISLTSIEELGTRIRHEMRSDINTVRGYTEMLLEDAEEDEAQADVSSDLHKIHASAGELLEHINDIIDFSGVVSGQIELEPDDSVDATLIQGVVATMQQLDSTRGESEEAPGRILVVDDNERNLDLVSKRLDRAGHSFATAVNGEVALEMLQTDRSFELVLLDIMMPVMDGYQLLQRLKTDEATRHIPVIMLSALDHIDNVVRCIEMGADDFLPKPVNAVLLEARIGACLEKKRFRDKERRYLEEIRLERQKSERLLLNILPGPIAEELKKNPSTIAESFEQVTVLFSDFVGFTKISAQLSAEELVERLNTIFKAFDHLADDHGVEKIKTIGDAYMVAGGLPTWRPDHAERIADFGIDMLEAIRTFNQSVPEPFDIRVGINTGPVVAGVIGSKKFAYDLWGDAVNTSSRMESYGVPGRIQVSESTHLALQGKGYDLELRGTLEIKGKGEMKTYFLNGKL
jgi:class 3 adenylate cyclase